MDTATLTKLGLTRGEIQVYLALLELKNATSGPIVDKSGISKSKVYEILERLTKKGIVSQIVEERVKKFQAVSPEILLQLCKEQERELQTVEKELQQLVPQLLARYNSIKEKQQVTIFQGYEGMKQVFNDVLKKLEEKDEYLVFSASGIPDTFLPFIIEWNKEREKKRINFKIIFNTTASKQQVNTTKKFRYTQIKTIGEAFNTPAVFNLYKNTTGILIWSKNPFSIVIESKEVTESFKRYFEMLWCIAK